MSLSAEFGVSFKSDGSVILVWFLLISFCFPQLISTNESARSSRRFRPSGFSRASVGLDRNWFSWNPGRSTFTGSAGMNLPKTECTQRFFGGTTCQTMAVRCYHQQSFSTQKTVIRDDKSLFQLCVCGSSCRINTI